MGSFGVFNGTYPGRPKARARIANEDGSGSESNASKPGCAKFNADVNMSVALSVLLSTVKMPVKLQSVLPLPKAYIAAKTSLVAMSCENSSAS